MSEGTAVAFHEAERRLGVTAGAEKRVLLWLAGRTPAWVQPDHLTLLGLVASLAGGLAYAAVARDLGWLHAANLCLLLNWLGDSLDGTLARRRRRERPRYGFYVDHLVDGVGALFLAGGLALSGLIHPALAAGLLVAYYLVNIEIYLATYTLGVFEISFGPLGGTELRLAMGALNLLALRSPRAVLAGVEMGLYDVVALFAIPGLLAVLLLQAARHARRLALLERPTPDSS